MVVPVGLLGAHEAVSQEPAQAHTKSGAPQHKHGERLGAASAASSGSDPSLASPAPRGSAHAGYFARKNLNHTPWNWFSSRSARPRNVGNHRGKGERSSGKSTAQGDTSSRRRRMPGPPQESSPSNPLAHPSRHPPGTNWGASMENSILQESLL